MRVLFLVLNLDIVDLDVQELVDRDQSTLDHEVILELHRYRLTNDGLEEGVEQL